MKETTNKMDLEKLDEPLPPKGKKGVLYFDLETVPDYERMSLFDFEPVPDPKPRGAINKCPAVSDLLKGTLDKIKEDLKFFNPEDSYLDAVDQHEKTDKKPRKGVFDATKELREQDKDREEALAAQRKTMSVTPEFNRIVAFGWSLDGEVQSKVVGEIDKQYDPEFGPVNCERDILEQFWSLANRARYVCGFNILGFDLPTIFVRSMLLDVSPTRSWDLKPWGTDVIDLMKKRFPSSGAMGLKKICKAMGIPIPAGDVDGSQVEALFKTDPELVGKYVRSDVLLLLYLHEMYSGFFV